jgi:hypothetical protein
MPGKQQIDAVTGAGAHPHGIGTALTDLLQVGIKTGLGEPVDDVLRQRAFTPGRTRDIDHLHQRRFDRFGGNVLFNPRIIRMAHTTLND